MNKRDTCVIRPSRPGYPAYGVESHDVGGWLTAKYLAESPTEARLTRDYDATELTVSPGEQGAVYLTESGLCWCPDAAGRRGWVPTKVLSERP